MVTSGSAATDTVVFTTTGEIATALSIVWQGNTTVPGGIVFGDGVRCITGLVKRLYTKTADTGSITAPAIGDASVKTRSASVGDTILPGSTRYYQVYYRDSNVVFCAPGFNVTNAAKINW